MIDCIDCKSIQNTFLCVFSLVMVCLKETVHINLSSFTLTNVVPKLYDFGGTKKKKSSHKSIMKVVHNSCVLFSKTYDQFVLEISGNSSYFSKKSFPSAVALNLIWTSAYSNFRPGRTNFSRFWLNSFLNVWQGPLIVTEELHSITFEAELCWSGLVMNFEVRRSFRRTEFETWTPPNHDHHELSSLSPSSDYISAHSCDLQCQSATQWMGLHHVVQHADLWSKG